MQTSHFLRRGGIALAVALACGNAALAADTVTFTKKSVPGLKVAFTQNMTVDMALKMSANGQVLQQMQQTIKQLRDGSSTVDAIGPDGLPSKSTFVFSPNCGGETAVAGMTSQPMPTALAGKTITVTKNNNDPKDLTFAGGEGLDQPAMIELTDLFRQDHTMMPTKPVAVGDSWDINPADLQSFVPPGSGAEAKATGKLLGVRTVDNRQIAEIEMNITMKGNANGVTVDSTLYGRGTVDVMTSQPIEISITGPIVAKGQQQGPQGLIDVAVDGRMTATIKSTLTGGLPTPTPAPGPVVPQQPVANLAGTYADAKLTFNFTGTGGTIKMGDKEYPVVATANGPKVTGEFKVGDKAFPFTATLDSETMTFVTGSTTYKLKRAGGGAVNPLDQ